MQVTFDGQKIRKEKTMEPYKKGRQLPEQGAEPRMPNHSHAWRGTWNRPVNVDEDSLHPFTVARMTDHNVRGIDNGTDERQLLKDNQKETGRFSGGKKAA
jgi:hypothetical protein